jgi:hypothetical protein
MIGSFHLLGTRRFLPLFTTQLLGAFNDNLFKNAMVLFVVYQVYNDERSETWFSAITTGVFILPFFCCRRCQASLPMRATRRGSSASSNSARY